MKLGEFRKLTQHLSDDVEIITTSDNYEMGHEWVQARGVRVVKVKKQTKRFRDDFDGTSYSSEVFVQDEDGIDAIKI